MPNSFLTSQNIWRALVALIRGDSPIRTALVGGIHEGLAPEKTAYPHCVWNAATPGVNEDDWSGRMILALGDVIVVSRNSVEASDLDQSLNLLFDEAALPVTGHTTLICHRVADIRDNGRDAEGRKVYRIGGSYEIVTDQAG